MARALHFDLVSPERVLRSQDVTMVVVPGVEGDFAVLAGHAPFMSSIRMGAIAIHAQEDGAPEHVFIDGGFAEVNQDGLTILAQYAVPVQEIDVATLTGELADAREDLKLVKDAGQHPVIQRRIARLEAMLASAQAA